MTAVLIVGAGALGRVFGAWLAAAGAQVSYLVKPGREDLAEVGVRRLRRWRAPVDSRFAPHRVGSAPGGPYDQVWLCVASDAVAGDWSGLRDAVGDATVVTIGQGLADLDALGRYWPREQLVQVSPSVLAFPDGPHGIAYWRPPGVATTVTGPRSAGVVALLRAGGDNARPVRRAGSAELLAARMIPFVAALEVAGWGGGGVVPLRLAAGASREAARVVSGRFGLRVALTAPGWVAGVVLRVLPWVTPFDLRGYVESHFTKVGGQTRLMLDDWIAASSGPTPHLVALRKALG